MKTMILAAVTVLSLGTSAAFAQGLPPGATPPVYGARAFSDQPYHNKTVFSEIFSQVRNSQVAAERTTPSTKGG
jgi:hypothetical protein